MTHKPLTSCPACSSALIHPVEAVVHDAATVVERRCPECEHRDRVLVASAAYGVWARSQARQRIALAADLLVLEAEAFLAEYARPA